MKLKSALALTSMLAGSLFLTTAGCAAKETAPPAQSITETSSARPASNPGMTASRSIVVSDDIARACNIDFNSADRAPKFDFDKASLSPQDRDLLTQIAKCLTTGPLQGRSTKLVGRADPRGEGEYNMALGEHRAGSALAFLSQLGVAKAKMTETSRGKLDATGTDEATWRLDRRVDILLQ
ncbi:MAG: OmpA family protein [Polyangiaceae bacterium]